MHIYREVSSAQVHRDDSINRQKPPMNFPAVPTRTSSLNPEKLEKMRKLPSDIFERYIKSVYNPHQTTDTWNTKPGNASSPVIPNGNFKLGNSSSPLSFNGNANLRHSFRGLNGHRSRALSPSNNNNNSSVRVNMPSSADTREGRPASNSPPMYKIRARSNSFKENHNNGWINVGPEFSIKPANGVQPVINVTILPISPLKSEPDYTNFDRISAGNNGNITVQAGSYSRPVPQQITRPKENFRETYNNHVYVPNSPSNHDRDGLYQIYSSSVPAAVPPNSVLPPVPQEKEKTKLSTLLRRRNSSMSRGHTPSSTQPLQRTYSVNLKPALKKRSSSQSYFEPKKNVTFSEYTTVYT